MTTKKAKYIIVDDHPLIREGIKNSLPTTYELIGEFSGVGHLKSAICPDFILLDINLPGKDGIKLCEELKRDYPNCKIIALTQYANMEDTLIENKFDGYVTKDNTDILTDAIEVVLRDEKYFLNPRKKRGTDEQGHFADEYITKYHLEPREIEVMSYVIDEKNNYTSKKIGEILYISEFTVQTHRRNFIKKTGLKNKFQIRKFMEKYGLISKRP